MPKYTAYFLDVDGTLLDSLDTKNSVFIESLFEEGIPRSFSSKIILESTALTRTERFKKVWRAYHQVEIPRIILEKLLTVSETRLLNAKYAPLPGADLFLKTYEYLAHLHIVSSANHIEVIESFKRLGWTNYFKSIHTGTANKSEVFNKIILEFAYPRNKCLSVGDTQMDIDAAVESGIDYWCIGATTNQEPKKINNFVGKSIDFSLLIKHLKH